MANRMSDLNRQKRNFAYSGQADTGDIPWLYEIAAQQAAGNQPAGIGQQGGGMDDGAAANPQDLGGGGVGGGTGGGGGGASGGADVGMSGPGITGGGEELDNLYRMWEQGGQAGEPGGAGAGGITFDGNHGYVDPTFAEIVGYLGPGPLGWVGGIGAAGMRGYNAGLLDTELENAGFTGLSGWQQAGAAFGTNDYGAGDPRDTYGANGIGGLAEAAYEAQVNAGDFNSVNDPAMGVSANQRAREDTRGGQPTGGSAYGGGSALGASASARHAERGGLGGGGAGEGGRGDTRDREGKSSADRHGAGNYHSGGYVSEDNNPNQLRGDVQTTLQEGEGVLTADAMEVLTPGFVHGINMMAKMMRTRR